MLEVAKTVGIVCGFIVYYVVNVAGIAAIPLGLPGQFAIVLTTGVLMLIGGAALIPWWLLLTILGLAIAGELVEALAGLAGAASGHGSFRSAVGAGIGGIVGAVVGSAFAPIIGSLIGTFVGTFSGAYLVELHRTGDHGIAATTARGAIFVRLIASAAKLCIALIMLVLVTTILIAHAVG